MLDAITDGKLTAAQTKVWLTSIERSELARRHRGAIAAGQLDKTLIQRQFQYAIENIKRSKRDARAAVRY